MKRTEQEQQKGYRRHEGGVRSWSLRKDWGCVKLFAGSAVLTEAWRGLGLRVAPPFEINDGPEYDLCHPRVRDSIFKHIRAGSFAHIHLGTPCGAWSAARRGVTNERKALLKERLAVQTALFTSEVIMEASRCGGVSWS